VRKIRYVIFHGPLSGRRSNSRPEVRNSDGGEPPPRKLNGRRGIDADRPDTSANLRRDLEHRSGTGWKLAFSDALTGDPKADGVRLGVVRTNCLSAGLRKSYGDFSEELSR
jgi:hypothetical protein